MLPVTEAWMAAFDYSIVAELFPTRSEIKSVPSRRRHRRASPLGYGRFASAADAIRFAIEELPPRVKEGSSTLRPSLKPDTCSCGSTGNPQVRGRSGRNWPGRASTRPQERPMRTHRFGRKIKLPATIVIKHQLRKLTFEDAVKTAEAEARVEATRGQLRE